MRKLILLYWLLPAYLLFLTSYEGLSWLGIEETYADGENIAAAVEEFKIKNMQAQSNGYIVLRFQADGEEIQRKLSLPVQMAAQLQTYSVIPIRYKSDSFIPIVLVPVYEFHSNMVLMNVAITGLSFLVVFIIGFFVSKYAFKKSKYELEDEQIQAAYQKMKSA
jgi:uncharacterized protein YneF (UPF0154 family)